MKAKRASACIGILVVLLVSAILFGCDSSSLSIPLTPKFLIAVDGATAGNNVNVFPIDATTGVLGAPVVGSPFNMGLTIGMSMVVHPNGHFAYVADGGDGSIHAWDVNENTGVPTEIAAPVINGSGSFYEPCCGEPSDAPTHVLAITPGGKFLYSANNDATVGAYKVNANGSLALIGDLNIDACDTGAITANNSFVWVTDTCGDSGPWHVMTMKINSDGSLTKVSTANLTEVYTWLWSIAVDPTANFLYVGDEGGDAQVYSFQINADGSLTQLGPQLVENDSSDCRDIAFSPDGKFFYTTDDATFVHAFSVNTSTGAITELSVSPYTGGSGQIVADLTGQFVFLADQDDTGSIVGYKRSLTTGELTPIGTTPTADGSPLAVNIIR